MEKKTSESNRGGIPLPGQTCNISCVYGTDQESKITEIQYGQTA